MEGLDEKKSFKWIKFRQDAFQKHEITEVNGSLRFETYDLKGVVFEECDFTDVDMSWADVEGASFIDCTGLTEATKWGLDEFGVYSDKKMIQRLKIEIEVCKQNKVRLRLNGINFAFMNFEVLREIRRMYILYNSMTNESSIDLKRLDFAEVNMYGARVEDCQFLIWDINLPMWIRKGLDKRGIYNERRLIDLVHSVSESKAWKILEGAYISDINNLPENMRCAVNKDGVFMPKVQIEFAIPGIVDRIRRILGR